MSRKDDERTYEPRIFEGRVMLPDENARVQRKCSHSSASRLSPNSMRELIEDLWPELAHRLPPKE
jgi:hypothetical protein